MTTKIEWADETINPITGCTQISEGCANCYAKRMATRLAGRYGYPKSDPFRPGAFHPEEIKKPSKWKKPRRIFVCSMGYIFHERVAPGDLCDVFEMMHIYRRHTFMLLTKRPERAPKHVSWWTKNIWLGVSAENQARADERIPILLRIPAAVRFVSVEPMLGPVDIANIQKAFWLYDDEYGSRIRRREDGIHWVICGGETGPGKRKMETKWATDLRDQCVAAGVPFFFKKDSNGSHELDGRTWEQTPEVSR